MAPVDGSVTPIDFKIVVSSSLDFYTVFFSQGGLMESNNNLCISHSDD